MTAEGPISAVYGVAHRGRARTDRESGPRADLNPPSLGVAQIDDPVRPPAESPSGGSAAALALTLATLAVSFWVVPAVYGLTPESARMIPRSGVGYGLDGLLWWLATRMMTTAATAAKPTRAQVLSPPKYAPPLCTKQLSMNWPRVWSPVV